MPDRARSVVAWLERHQVAVYLGAIGGGGALGALAPMTAAHLEPAITPVLGALLYVTFLQVPLARLRPARADRRFVAAALVVNFAVVPVVVAAMFGFLPGDPAIRTGVLLVLLCPCVDYVIVFSGLAGADSGRLLALTPLLLLVQMLALPLFLLAFLGPGLTAVVRFGPFLTAFATLIVIPLLLAGLTRSAAARTRAGERASDAVSTTMVPLMALTLLAVVASQAPKLDQGGSPVLRLVPFYLAFLVIMAGAGLAVARAFRLGPEQARAVIFTGGTRNSLVVLPLALALPGPSAGVAAAAVITQTLVEVIGMLVYVRAVPLLVPGSSTQRRSGARSDGSWSSSG